MNAQPNEHSRRRAIPLALGVLVFVASVAAAGGVHAQGDPPAPGFSWPYGRVLLEGENIEPAQQPVIALVNGLACGEATTQLATPGPGIPLEDAGKTVYVVNVLPEGTGAGQRPGCGTPGAPIALYFPLSGRMAFQQAVFVAGPQRIDVDLGPPLTSRLVAPVVSSDGVN